jgi:hypothetical protein
VPDFDMKAIDDITRCPWWRPLTVHIVNEPPRNDRVGRRFLQALVAAFERQGHEVLPESTGAVDLLLAFEEVAAGGEDPSARITERAAPLAFSLMQDFGLPERPEHLVVFLSLPERLGDRPHVEVIETARTAMARIGTPKVVFLSGDRESGALHEATLCTLEGGHPTVRDGFADQIRDRLVTAACAHEVGGRYEVLEGGLDPAAWDATPIPEALIEAGHRMDELGLLPPPKRVSEYVSPKLAAIYQRYLGIKGFSEGMLFAYEPEIGALMVTASGSWDVDKRALRRDEVVTIGGSRGDKLQVLAPPGVSPKGPSVEAWEMYMLLQGVPQVRVAPDGAGGWSVDPEGPVQVPIVRAGIHTHSGVEAVDEDLIESIPANRELVPFGFGCGTDLMRDVARDAARRSRAINDPSDRRCYVRWPMLYHGDTVVELWKPGVSRKPLEGLLDLYEPDRLGAIRYTPDHIEQPT